MKRGACLVIARPPPLPASLPSRSRRRAIPAAGAGAAAWPALPAFPPLPAVPGRRRHRNPTPCHAEPAPLPPDAMPPALGVTRRCPGCCETPPLPAVFAVVPPLPAAFAVLRPSLLTRLVPRPANKGKGRGP